ncbi:MAG: phosphoglucosamine mutase, partial [Actinobacteria bacterium]|nr:phosphoglucosamine mutase [Actinomycetota bacterium]
MKELNRNEATHKADDLDIAGIHFGTDGWRAIIDEDFNPTTVTYVAVAIARIFQEECEKAGLDSATVYIGHDTRRNADRYAAFVAQIVAACGTVKPRLEVKLTRRYCPTPTLCWTVAHDSDAIGGIMLTASHNPAEWLGIKIRMADGGASPKAFTDRVEEVIRELPSPPYDADVQASYETIDFEPAYKEALLSQIDAKIIAAAGLRVVVDPLYGAGRSLLPDVLRHVGVEVEEIHATEDPTFAGLHPEPILPWVDEACAKVREGGFDAGFITDGDADRIGAIDSHGNFINPHRILCLIIGHLAENRGRDGRVVSTMSASTMISKQCERLGLPYTITPVGFKWIYEEMLKGDVIVGGEESGGIGVPGHVSERDGLLMALLLCELMATTGKKLEELLDEMFAEIGEFQYKRYDMRIDDAQMVNFLACIRTYECKEIASR